MHGFVPEIIHAWMKNHMRFPQQTSQTYTLVKRRQISNQPQNQIAERIECVKPNRRLQYNSQ